MKGLAVAESAKTRPSEWEEDLAEARAGSRDAFDRLILRFESRVMKTALFLLRNVSDAEDAAQETYVRIFRNLHRCRTPEKIDRWIYRITVNACRDVQRRRRIWAPLLAVKSAIRPPDPVFKREFGGRFVQALARLSLNERAAFVLGELEELETSEVAHILRCAPVTVRGYLHEARKKLRREFRDLRSV
jgi:RNA polymerase sigma-70 factor (ECF subfamily)